MTRTILLALALLWCSTAFCQTGFMVLKKKERTIQAFYRDGHFTFQNRDGSWITGIITAIKKDSFYLTQEIIHYYLMGSDTVHISGLRFSLNDVRALPTKKEELVYVGDQVAIVPGHEKWVWVRNGLIFQLGGASYIAFGTLNSLIRGERPFEKKRLNGLGIAAAAFLFGTLLHVHYDPYIHPGKKYRLQCIILSSSTTERPG